MEARRTLNFFFTDAAVLNMGKAKSAGKLAAKAAKKVKQEKVSTYCLSLIHISEPTRPRFGSRMPSSA